MYKYLVSVVFVCLFALAAPSVSSAAFLNYSGTLPNVSAKFMVYNSGTEKFDQVQCRANANGSGLNAEVDFDHVSGRLTSDVPDRPSAVFDNAVVWLDSVNMLPAGKDKYVGNCRVEIQFFTGSVSYDPILETYAGTGWIYRLQGGAQALIVSDSSKKRGVLKVNRVMPYSVTVQYVGNGSLTEPFTPALVKSVSLPGMQLKLQPLP